MKVYKIVMCVISCGLCFSAHAFDVCKRNNSFVGTYQFDKTVDGTLNQSDADEKIWKVTYNYDGEQMVVTGNAACNAITGTVGVVNMKLLTNAIDMGVNCWCQMYPIKSYSPSTPVSSYWVLLQVYSDTDACHSSCAAACGNAMATDSSFRTAIWHSIW